MLLSYLHCLETPLTALGSSQSLTVVVSVAAAVHPAVKPTETAHATKMVQGVCGSSCAWPCDCNLESAILIEAESAAVSPTEALTSAANAVLLAAAWP